MPDVYTRKSQYLASDILSQLTTDKIFNGLSDSQQLALLNLAQQKVGNIRNKSGSEDFLFDTVQTPDMTGFANLPNPTVAGQILFANDSLEWEAGENYGFYDVAAFSDTIDRSILSAELPAQWVGDDADIDVTDIDINNAVLKSIGNNSYGVNFNAVKFHNCYSEGSFTNSEFTGCILSNCIFDFAQITDTTFTDCKFFNCYFIDTTTFDRGGFEDCDFYDCVFAVSIDNWDITDTNFYNCTFLAPTITADLDGVKFSNCLVSDGIFTLTFANANSFLRGSVSNTTFTTGDAAAQLTYFKGNFTYSATTEWEGAFIT